jgi:hypothetical protein
VLGDERGRVQEAEDTVADLTGHPQHSGLEPRQIDRDARANHFTDAPRIERRRGGPVELALVQERLGRGQVVPHRPHDRDVFAHTGQRPVDLGAVVDLGPTRATCAGADDGSPTGELVEVGRRIRHFERRTTAGRGDAGAEPDPRRRRRVERVSDERVAEELVVPQRVETGLVSECGKLPEIVGGLVEHRERDADAARDGHLPVLHL